VSDEFTRLDSMRRDIETRAETETQHPAYLFVMGLMDIEIERTLLRKDTMSTTNALNERFELVAISTIAESATNPRKTYDDKAMKELTASVASKGILVPPIVRPHPKPKALITHELVAGSRRLRAALAAKLTEIPVVIRNYTDEQVLEVQIIENLQREDVHPLEEALGYQMLLKHAPLYTPEVIAEKIGHPLAYVQKRLALVNLIKEAQKDFLACKINIGHALLLARLPEDKQKFAYKELLYHDAGRERIGDAWVELPSEACTVAQLDAYIKSQIFLALDTAPWKKDDATLLPKAGACNVCPKRSGASPSLFDELQKGGDNCLDPTCFQSKADAYLVQIEKAKKESGEKVVRITERSRYSLDKDETVTPCGEYELIEGKTKKCENMETGLFVDGPRKAQTVRICADSKCKIHHPRHASYSGSGGSSQPKENYWNVREGKLEQNIKTAVRRATVEAILAKPHKWEVPQGQLQLIALSLLQQSIKVELLDALALPGVPLGQKLNGYDTSKEIEKFIRAGKGMPAAEKELPRIVTALSLQKFMDEFEPYNDDRLKLAAAAFGVDEKKISIEIGTSLRTEFKAKRKAAEERTAAQEKPKAAKVKKAPVVKQAKADKNKTAPAKKKVATKKNK
jgi:ParB family chromosome partitioning protein